MVHVWDMATGKKIRTLKGHKCEVTTVAFAPDGKTVASGSRDGTVRLWDVPTGKEIHNLKGNLGRVLSVSFSSDGKTVAAGGNYGLVCLWEVATGKKIHTLGRPQARKNRFGRDEGGVGSVAFSSDGKTVALWSRDSTVRLWDMATGKEIRTLKGAAGSVVFSPDSKIVATGENQGTVRLWETATGKEIRTLQGYKGAVHGVNGVAFAPDGKTLVSVSEDATGLVWDLTHGAVRPETKLGPDALETLWTDLASQDASRAWRAIWALAATPAQSVPLLRDRLRPVPADAGKQIARLIADLDAADFQVRQKASQELEKLGPDAESALRESLASRPSLEMRKRLEQLLEAGRTYSGELLRSLRAMEVLEQIGTTEARQVLKTLAAGAPGFCLTQEAQASLRRLQEARRP